MKTDAITTGKAKLWLDEDGIFHLEWNPGAEITIKDARKSTVALLQFSQGKRGPLLVDIREIKSITQEARAYYSSEESSSLVPAFSLLVGSPISRMIGNFSLGINKPAIPVSLFTDEEKALVWLRTFLEDENGKGYD